ncbi:aminotransferase class I/II-fold pyridoxal phosphate-dependent enzyme [Mucilaginibacter sp. JRF]|uniref:aminotransferase class I/II-fold pyridoxal phosphate-dependent enzyme n=1 Tax=Mucilaginibacter sp. JRF TaxID=2780088 RepID=UPI00187E52E4|nr:aminotransferase class I/II-fold pyridoxal phosphate-dependent enzyme [Mucilaginibacter sp. JRF]MBE9586479.1 aminotransferase class I/II-fold pyridoxal phosphate-dependent enzyme [Mucilaginibacter sp. JRF]
MDLSYILNELGEERDQYYNAVSPPVMQSSNFAFNTVADMRSAMSDEFDATLYSRGQNPTLNILRKKLAALDGAGDALLFSSGIAAISTSVLALVKQGDHVVCVENPYSWTDKLFRHLLPKFGISTTFVTGTALSDFEDAAKPNTRLIYLESPNTFTYELQDLEAVARFAKARGIITIIDNSYCTPLFQQPIKLGIDLVAQSATKYIGGHSDVMAGVVTGSCELIRQIFEHEFMNLGPALSPHSAWLLLRGLRTLPLRLQRSFESTQVITNWLAQHDNIDTVLWPFSTTFPQFELAHEQMQGCGGLFSIALKNSSYAKIEAFCNSLQHMLIAVSWGGHESLVMPAIASIPPEKYDVDNPRHQYIRVYIGLEEPQYLINDMQQALEKVKLLETVYS